MKRVKKGLKICIPILVSLVVMLSFISPQTLFQVFANDEQIVEEMPTTNPTEDTEKQDPVQEENPGVDNSENKVTDDVQQPSEDSVDNENKDAEDEIHLVNVSPYALYLNEPTNDDLVPDHHKSIQNNNDGTYTLTLNVKGQIQTVQGEKSKVDVLLIVDKSGSMANDGKMTTLKNAITGQNGLSSSLLDRDDIDARMAVVAYSGDKGNRSWWNYDETNPNNDTTFNDAVTVSN